MSAAIDPAGSSVDILIAEDSPTQAQRLQRLLEQQGYQVRHAGDGRQALEAAQRQKPTLIVSDVIMPAMDGYELCRSVKADPDLADTPVILVTTLSDPQDVIRGLECGADNFVLKPYEERHLLSRVQFVLLNREVRQSERAGMGVEVFFNGQRHFITADRLQILNLLLSTYEAAINKNKELNEAQDELRRLNVHMEKLVRARTRQLEQTYQEMLQRLAQAAEFRDDETGQHTRRVGESSARIAAQLELGAEEVDMIRQAAPLHDVGKIAIPDVILLSKDRLTPEEMAVMRTHTTVGARILSQGSSNLLWMAERIALTHHERWDGTGYPQGLAGDAIPIEGRIVALADFFDALSHDRRYRPAWPREKVLDEIAAQSGRHFDPRIVTAFVETVRSA